MQSAKSGDDTVRKQLQGIAVMLLSILLMLGFDSIGIKYVFDLSLHWSTIFRVIGIIGFIMVFRKDNNKQ